jgi:hypothetical protein
MKVMHKLLVLSVLFTLACQNLLIAQDSTTINDVLNIPVIGADDTVQEIANGFIEWFNALTFGIVWGIGWVMKLIFKRNLPEAQKQKYSRIGALIVFGVAFTGIVAKGLISGNITWGESISIGLSVMSAIGAHTIFINPLERLLNKLFKPKSS